MIALRNWRDTASFPKDKGRCPRADDSDVGCRAGVGHEEVQRLAGEYRQHLGQQAEADGGEAPAATGEHTPSTGLVSADAVQPAARHEVHHAAGDDIPCREEAKRHGDHGSGRRAEKRDRQGLPQRAEIARRRARFRQEFAVAQFSASLTSASIRSRIAQRLEL
jgi:hypothetical protein